MTLSTKQAGEVKQGAEAVNGKAKKKEPTKTPAVRLVEDVDALVSELIAGNAGAEQLAKGKLPSIKAKARKVLAKDPEASLLAVFDSITRSYELVQVIDDPHASTWFAGRGSLEELAYQLEAGIEMSDGHVAFWRTSEFFLHEGCLKRAEQSETVFYGTRPEANVVTDKPDDIERSVKRLQVEAIWRAFVDVPVKPEPKAKAARSRRTSEEINAMSPKFKRNKLETTVRLWKETANVIFYFECKDDGSKYDDTLPPSQLPEVAIGGVPIKRACFGLEGDATPPEFLKITVEPVTGLDPQDRDEAVEAAEADSKEKSVRLWHGG